MKQGLKFAAKLALSGIAIGFTLGSVLIGMSGCTTTAASTPAQAEQVAYTQACAAYGAAFSTALELRRAGRLKKAQIDQVTILDGQVTPICTGPLPADATTAIRQVTAAATSLTILEVAHQEN